MKIESTNGEQLKYTIEPQDLLAFSLLVILAKVIGVAVLRIMGII